MTRRLSIVDLFSGGGGFSLGARMAGFDVSLAVDIDPVLSSSYHINFPAPVLRNWDVTEAESSWFRSLVPQRIDGIIGGPPCQPFSEMGKRRKDDERRDVLSHFFRLVSALQPRFFIMENVRGLGFQGNRELLDAAINRVADKYVILGPVILDAGDFGAPTKRKRLFVFGFDPSDWDLPSFETLNLAKTEPVTVRDAIHDLKSASLVGGDTKGWEWWRYDERRKQSYYARVARSVPPIGFGSGAISGWFTGHTKTVHAKRVINRFRKVPMGKYDAVGKHPRLDWNGLSPTLRAGTGNDHGGHQSLRPIHPDENRVITVREAARLQGFPDWFIFHPAIWHSFRMIGNSVSPILSRAILTWIAGHSIQDIEFMEAAE